MRKEKDVLVLRAVAAEIKARRAGLQISQEELAHRAGIHRSFVAKLETANTQPSLSVLFRIAEALDASVVEVVGGIMRRHQKEVHHKRRAS